MVFKQGEVEENDGKGSHLIASSAFASPTFALCESTDCGESLSLAVQASIRIDGQDLGHTKRGTGKEKRCCRFGDLKSHWSILWRLHFPFGSLAAKAGQ